MPFIGKNPKPTEDSNFTTRRKDDFTPNGSTTQFTLSKAVGHPNDIAVFVGNVRQEPTAAYTVNGTTLDFGSGNAPPLGMDMYVVHQAGTLESSVVPADGTISTAKIASNAVTAAKIPNDSVTSAKISDNSFMTDLWFLDQDRAMAGSSCRLGHNDSTTWVQASESTHSGYGYGTIGTDKMSVSSDIFTFPTTGVYRIDYLFNVISDNADTVIRGDILTSIDGSTYLDTAKQMLFNSAGSQTMGGSVSYHFRVSNTSTHKVKFTLDSATGATIEGGGLGNNGVGPMCTYVVFQRLGD